jgi:hypothetical protein
MCPTLLAGNAVIVNSNGKGAVLRHRMRLLVKLYFG